MAAGRPTIYTKGVIDGSYEYIRTYAEIGERVPTVVGLCKFINRSKTVVYDWAKEEGKEEFADILSQISEIQHLGLVNSGLAGDFNPAITKMMLTHHGYSDKVEQAITGAGGGAVQTDNKWTIEFVNADPQSK